MNILIIEDDAATAEFVAGAFKQVGYATMHVADGEAGLAAALHGPYDAAVVDIMLPRLDGLEVIRRVRAAGRPLPIIVLSARGSVDAKIRGLEATTSSPSPSPSRSSSRASRRSCAAPAARRKRPSSRWRTS